MADDKCLAEQIEDLEMLADDARVASERFLRRRGWNHTSATPGSLWLWTKMIEDGRVVMVSRETAMYMERWWASATDTREYDE